MQIKITPEDIVKRGMWDFYTYYIIGSEKEAQELLKKNEEFILSEKDAIVIGLLKVMETDNLIHRFNDYLVHFLSIRSIKEKSDALIKKKTLEQNKQNREKQIKDQTDRIAELEKEIDGLKGQLEDTIGYIEGVDSVIAYWKQKGKEQTNAEPVAWTNQKSLANIKNEPQLLQPIFAHGKKTEHNTIPLYTTPQTKPLSDEEIDTIRSELASRLFEIRPPKSEKQFMRLFAKAIEERILGK